MGNNSGKSKIIKRRYWRVLPLVLLATMPVISQVPPSVMHFPEEVESVDIPFTRYRDWIIVEAQVNGSRELKFILDTGAPIAVLGDPEAGGKLGIPIAGQALVDGGEGENAVPVALATGINIQLGPLEIGNCMLAIGAAGQAIYGVDGILGKYVFENAVVRVDWDKQTLTLTKPENFKYDGNGVRLPLNLATNGHIFTEITLLGEGEEKSIQATLDTGNRSNLKLDQPGYHDYYLGQSFERVVTGWGANGPEYGELAKIDVALGGHVIKGVIASSRQQPLPDTSEPPKGNIGISILERFNLIFDYRNSVLILEKNKFYDKEFHFTRSGIQLRPDQSPQLQISGIIPGSPAEREGLLTGDTIRQINGRQVETLTTEEIDALVEGKVADSILLVIERNGTRLVKQLRMRTLF